MRWIIALLSLLLLSACGSTRKQLARADQYEQGGMMQEAFSAYEELFDRRPKAVSAHLGMKRTAQSLLDRKIIAASERYMANDLGVGDRNRTEAMQWKRTMDGKGLALQWDDHVDDQRRTAQRNKARTLLDEANTFYREERFAEAQDMAEAAVKLDHELKEADYLALLAQLEPRYRQGRKAEELGLWRAAFTQYVWITDRDVDYKDAWDRMAVAKGKAMYTLAYVPLFNELLYTVQLGMPGQVEEQLSANLKAAILDLKDPLILLVDRDNTHEILAEQQRNMQGTYDDRYAAEAGDLLGARYVLTGRILRFDDILIKQIEVQIQMLDVQTGRIMMADMVRVNRQEIGKGTPRAQLLERAASRIAQRISEFDPGAK
ncbi:MAG: hypothetical protein IPH05_15825 [Flavobacteriales bacterium]|nr:hypothetical protein [Flavobacteriales bacterium]MBK7484185.1 hypothetical protein [Flavobacteriales bacterium]